MSLENIKREVGMMLAEVEFRLGEAERQYDRGGDREKVGAAGDLVVLRSEKAMLAQRMSELASAPDGAREDAWQWLKEQWFNLMFRLDEWLATGSGSGSVGGR